MTTNIFVHSHVYYQVLEDAGYASYRMKEVLKQTMECVLHQEQEGRQVLLFAGTGQSEGCCLSVCCEILPIQEKK
jgi:hypothetical protein